MKVLIISAGRYPVPAVKGGAVSTLIQHLADGNETERLVELEISSPYNEVAAEKAKSYKACKFIFIKTPKILNFIENILYSIANILFPKKNLTQLKSALSFAWFVLRNSVYISRFDYDYIVFENTARLFLCLKLFGNATKYKDKVVYHLHNEPKKLANCREEIINSHRIICISDYIRKSIQASGSPLAITNSSTLRVVKNCVDTNLFAPVAEKVRQEYKKKFGFDKDDKVVVFSGRIDREKGIRELLAAFELIKTRGVKLLIVGSSFYGMDIRSEFEQEIFKLAENLKDRIVFTGFVKYEEMPSVYNAGDVVVLPSIWEEPAGLTIIEAMSCQRPVITTVSGGIPEYADNECAILLKRDESLVENIAVNIDMLIDNKDIADSLAVAGRKRVAERFSNATYMNHFYEALR